VLIALAAVRQVIAQSGVGTTLGALVGADSSGLVPRAEKVHEGLKRLAEERRQDAAHLAFLDGERRPGRIALELLAAIVEQQDPVTSPMVLREYRVRRAGTVTQVEIEGFAESAAKRSTADVQRAFERELARRYEPIAALAVKPATTEDGRLRFHFVIGIPDIQPTATTSTYAAKGGGKGLRIDVRGAGTLDAEGVARVAADRHRDDEDEVTIAVTGDDAKLDTWMWTAKGLTRSR
nr:hypothetical protein [Planctomycetota bacterium]